MSDLHQERFRFLLDNYLKGKLSEQDISEFFDLARMPENESILAEIMDQEYQRGSDDLTDKHEVDLAFHALMEKLGVDENRKQAKTIRLVPRWSWTAAAAILLIFAGVTSYFLLNQNKTEPLQTATQYRGDVQPGHTGAILHLSNGTTIVLDSAQDGTVAIQGAVKAIKSKGELKYEGSADDVQYNTVSTDRGRIWQLSLSDGTKVWLNAASSIRYPVAFRGGEREVEVTGEVYFEVVHDAKHPFKVKAGDQIVEDLGTSFDINTYLDQPAIVTTLVQGSIEVITSGQEKIIKPGEQTLASVTGEGIQVKKNVNIESVLAWKSGLFSFRNADIQTVMKQLSRWYDVGVRYEGAVDKQPFSGEIGRSLTLAQVLKGLEKSDVQFRIEEDKTIVILTKK